MNNNSFTVLPMSQRFSLSAGGSYKGKVTIVNPADAKEDFHYQVSVTPYGVTDEDYTADLTTDTNRTLISKWIKIDEPTGVIKPNESKEVTFTINVPNDAPGGGQYATIAISSDEQAAKDDGVAIRNIFEMASVVYGMVAGKTTHEGEILENNVPGFVVNNPVTLSALISNGGNVHEDAAFVITVSNFFTGQVILPTEEDDGEYSELIMPETTKHIERQVSGMPALGVMKVSQTIYYQGDVSTVEKNIIICPIWFLILLIATIAAIITTIVLIVKKHRKNKRVKRIDREDK